MTPSYQPTVVLLSILIAILVSYTALGMGGRIVIARRKAIKFWVLGGSVSMGAGIWSMHFIGMLAFHLPIPLAYDPWITFLSILPAILASAIALVAIRFKDKLKSLYYVAALLMGIGIAVMHYTGMAALRMQPPIQYDPLLFALSVIIAITASGAALYLAFQQQHQQKHAHLRHLLSAIVMGSAIAGMHYTGMWAANFPADSFCLATQQGGLDSDYLVILVSSFSLAVLGMTLIATFVDTIRGQNTFYRTLLGALSDFGEGVFLIENGKPLFANEAMTLLTGFSQTELLGMETFNELIIGDSHEQVLDKLSSDNTDDRSTYRFETALMTRQNKRIEVELAISSFFYADKLRKLIIVIDITERKNALIALQEQKAETTLLARVAANTDNAVIITNSNGRIEWVNAGFSRITGFQSLEAIGQKPGDLLQGEETDPQTIYFMREKLKQGEGFSTELINYARSGRKYWISINVQPVRNEEGKIEQFIAIERDITDWKNAMALLEKQKAESEMLAKVAATTDNGVLILDPSGHTEWINAGFTRITGYQLNELKGKKPGDILKGPETDPDTLNHIRESIGKGKSFKAEITNYTKNGDRRWVTLNGQPMLDAHGKVERIFIIESDITEQKEIQAKLERQKSESEMLAKVAANTDNGVIILRLDGQPEWINEGFTRIYGYTFEDIKGRSLDKILVGPETSPETLDLVRTNIINRQNFSTEILNYTKSGDKRWISMSAQPLRNSSGKVDHIFIMESDITEQKEAQAKLEKLNQTLEQRVLERTEEVERQRQFIETILDTAGNLILLLNHQYHIVRFNPACETLTGLELSKTQNKPFWDVLIPSQQRDQVQQIYCGDESCPPATTWESQLLTNDGNEIIIAWTNALIRDNAGNIQYIILSGIDITARKLTENTLQETNCELQQTIETLKEAQSQLVQSEKMASLGGLVAGISHEINTPIGIGVTSASSLDEEVNRLAEAYEKGAMKKSTLEDFISHARQASSILQNNLKRASELISSFKQVAVDQSSDTWRTLNIHDYIDEIITSLRPKWKTSRVRIINDCDINLIGYSYPGAIYQVVSNLILNSITHAFEAGDKGEIRLRAQQKDDHLELVYHDNGRGIPVEDQNRVFDPFFTTRRGSGGSGLGLHIVYNLVSSNLNGQISLQSNPQQGTTFTITIPFSQQDASIRQLQ